ncbi:MEKHLA domain-containing protein [Rubidibacter lacunae]|uniref:MEKHLA domain-containing protein n=1 Tax=Rubidibacter lacunae TaxID=582514 RepID=UPI0038CD8DBA
MGILRQSPPLEKNPSKLLTEEASKVFIKEYAGNRMSGTRRRFRIVNALAWNLTCPLGRIQSKQRPIEIDPTCNLPSEAV